MGRPRTSEETRDALVRAFERGLTQRDACDIVGVSRGQLVKWLQDGEREIEAGNYEHIDAAFAARVRGAQANYRATLVDVVNDGAKLDPELALKVLERRDPKEWRPQSAVDVNANVTACTLEDLEELRRTAEANES
jgi:transcriptional regulator with XRE-family HTH domain